MNFEVAPLPYAKDALQPVMSVETFDYHYEKHHKTYMTKLKGLIEGKPEASKTLEEVVKSSSGGVFNNAAQVWNHTFFWHCMAPNAGGNPTGAIAAAIDKSFGSFDDFKKKFSEASVGQFGSGWGWLVKNADGSLAIETTANAETPFAAGKTCVLTVDVWEHAYYIDYRNARAKFVEEWWKLVNWDFANKNLA
jgi:Fe-Mn family superoxide dismutase